MSSTSVSTTTYDDLLHLLHPSPPSLVLSIEILPPSHPNDILSAPPHIGIPRKVLSQSFLHARTIFHNRTHSPSEAVLQATKILTLYEPSWYTAWTYRKRHLLALHSLNDPHILEAVQAELAWTSTLLTSPLDKHAKSSWIWAHRLWLHRTFPTSDLTKNDREYEESSSWLQRELDIMMTAGERHGRNYYAWEYARAVVRVGPGLEKGEWEEVIGKVHGWCLMHPRDVSGWAFLVFSLNRVVYVDVDGMGIRRNVYEKTREFVQKYDWKGESIEWFLSARQLLMNSEKT